MDALSELLLGYFGLPLACIVLERLWPSVPGQRLLRPGFGADLLWYGCQTFSYRILGPFALFLVALPVIFVSGMSTERFFAGFGPVAGLPLWIQAIVVLVLGDFGAYWSHRLFHRPSLWKIHAVHHSSRQLDWLSAMRFHPVNEVGSQLIYASPLMFAGVDPAAYALVAPVPAVAAFVLHSNLRWTFGPLGRWLCSPVFHRWHHTGADEGGERNFGSLLSCWDVLFGTFYLPSGRPPRRFGTHTRVPEGFLAQLDFPFLDELQGSPARGAEATEGRAE